MDNEPRFENDKNDSQDEQENLKTYEMLKKFKSLKSPKNSLHDLVMKLKQDKTIFTEEVSEVSEDIFNQSFSFSAKAMSVSDLTEEDWG